MVGSDGFLSRCCNEGEQREGYNASCHHLLLVLLPSWWEYYEHFLSFKVFRSSKVAYTLSPLVTRLVLSLVVLLSSLTCLAVFCGDSKRAYSERLCLCVQWMCFVKNRKQRVIVALCLATPLMFICFCHVFPSLSSHNVAFHVLIRIFSVLWPPFWCYCRDSKVVKEYCCLFIFFLHHRRHLRGKKKKRWEKKPRDVLLKVDDQMTKGCSTLTRVALVGLL